MVQKGSRLAQLEGPRGRCFMILLMCRFQNHASHRGRGAFFHRIMAKAMRKCGNVTLNACDEADGAKYSFPKRAINKRYIFSNEFCKFQAAINGTRSVHIGPNGGPTKHSCHEVAFVPFSKPRFLPRGGAFFQKREQAVKKSA